MDEAEKLKSLLYEIVMAIGKPKAISMYYEIYPIKSIDLNCPECGKKMILKRSIKAKKFYGCTGYPECDVSCGTDKFGSPIGTPKTKAQRNSEWVKLIKQSDIRGKRINWSD